MRRAIVLLVVMATALALASGLALAVNKIGTQGRDFLKGTGGADTLVGRVDNDRIFSLAGKEILIGEPGKDLVWGGRIRSSHHDLPVDYTSSGGEKKLVGGSGNEVLYGGRGSDIMLGNTGNDLLIGNDFLSGNAGEYSHPVKDTLSGGGGNDVFGVENDPAGKNVVTCGGILVLDDTSFEQANGGPASASGNRKRSPQHHPLAGSHSTGGLADRPAAATAVGEEGGSCRRGGGTQILQLAGRGYFARAAGSPGEKPLGHRAVLRLEGDSPKLRPS
jgi:hypothetical protein